MVTTSHAFIPSQPLAIPAIRGLSRLGTYLSFINPLQLGNFSGLLVEALATSTRKRQTAWTPRHLILTYILDLCNLLQEKKL